MTRFFPKLKRKNLKYGNLRSTWDYNIIFLPIKRMTREVFEVNVAWREILTINALLVKAHWDWSIGITELKIFQLKISTLSLIFYFSAHRYSKTWPSNYMSSSFWTFGKGRVESSWMLQIFDPSDWCTDICKTIFAFFKPKFQHEDDLVQHRYFELFSRHDQYFHPTKDQPRTRPTSTFFVHLL